MSVKIEDMSLEEVIDYVDGKLTIDSDNLDMEALKQTKLFTDLNRVYAIHSRKLANLIVQKNKVEIHWYKHFAGKLSSAWYKEHPLPESVLKSDIPQYMNIQTEIVEMRGIVAEQERIVKFLEDSQSTLRSRGYDIKTALAFRQLMMGA